MTKLRDQKERYQRDYEHELHQREKDKECWQRTLANRDQETKALRRELAGLRGRLKLLRAEVKARTQQLEGLGHLVCDVCCDRPKYRVTRCGHGFCQACLARWVEEVAQTAAQYVGGAVVVGEVPCPACRRRLRQAEDVWPIYLSAAGE